MNDPETLRHPLLPMYPIYRRGFTLLMKKREGFTLIELFLVMGLLTVLLGAMTYTLVMGLRIRDMVLLSGGVSKEASFSLRIISEELRQATAVTAAGLHTLTFQADLDRNGAIDTITYSWSGTSGDDLVRTQATETAALAKGVQDASFQYYDSSNAILGPLPLTPAQLRLVKVVRLTLQVAKEGESMKYEVKIRPRGI